MEVVNVVVHYGADTVRTSESGVVIFMFKFVQMAAHALLSGVIDGKHRAKIWEGGDKPKILRTRGPAYNWMIHPDWVDRYV